jgi:benzodiazapine receptor
MNDSATRPMTNVAKIAVISVPLILGAGFLSGWLSNSGYGNDCFDALAKPAAMPPGWAFGTAWSILYVALGIVLALVWAAPPSKARTTALTLFFVQLGLNFIWSPVFFGAHQVALGLAVIVAILLLSIAATRSIARVSRAAAWLMVPYLAWLSFATYLNFEIVRLNPGA